MTRNMTCVAVCLVAALAVAGCGGSPASPTSSTTSASSTGSGTTLASSHNAGRDCSTCHSWTVAGTAYKSDGVTVYPGATIRLGTVAAGGGTTVITLTSDATGNFYTNATVTWGSGLYPTATATTGGVRSMSTSLRTGACNSCHSTGNRIIVS